MRGGARLGVAVQGKARQGECAGIQQVDQPTRYRRGAAWRGKAGLGNARQGKVNAPISSGSTDPLDTGVAGQGDAWLGNARQGKETAPLTGRGFYPVLLKAMRGMAWIGNAWLCDAGQGYARQGKAMKRRQYLVDQSTLLILAKQGGARHCTVRQGKAKKLKQGA